MNRTSPWAAALIAAAATFGITAAASAQEVDMVFQRGDMNADGRVDYQDAIAVQTYLYAGGNLRCQDAADVNDDGAINFDDLYAIYQWLYSGAKFSSGAGGSSPYVAPTPFGAAGVDTTADELRCDQGTLPCSFDHDCPGDETGCSLRGCAYGYCALSHQAAGAMCGADDAGRCTSNGECVECIGDADCNGTDSCGGGGEPFACGCTPLSCDTLGLACGVADDGCGGEVQCGGDCGYEMRVCADTASGSPAVQTSICTCSAGTACDCEVTDVDVCGVNYNRSYCQFDNNGNYNGYMAIVEPFCRMADGSASCERRPAVEGPWQPAWMARVRCSACRHPSRYSWNSSAFARCAER